MANSTDLSAAVIELLQERNEDMHAGDLVERLVGNGYDADQAVRGLDLLRKCIPAIRQAVG
jgi:hypothetical protein